MPFYRKRRSRRVSGQRKASIREGEADGDILIRMGLLRRLGFYQLPTASSTSVLQIPVFTLVSSLQIPHSTVDPVAQGQRSTPYIPFQTPLQTTPHSMCYWYKHDYSCKHVTYALGRYCSAANLIQTPCKKKNIWQTIRMGEECEDCAMPEGRGGSAAGGYDEVPEQKHKVAVKAKKGRKR
ncbi:hypothetical protein NA56DRAFT_742310 [Hyaloscypha hepaticicola]|uniref:Uncharacterized protein n=1 Tax=Hyaloscypha hepaticicola TaxID=2082293 RepID=A0A2J6QPE7_9HELO|nr:hypothetical protein NA56DRAFT_742310 [Hyaloscypha hepaticicola]